MIRYNEPDINKKDIASVVKVLKSGKITQGVEVEKFEEKLSNYSGSKYAVAVNSATSALHLSCLVLNIQKKDVVWVPAITFVSTANSVLFCGASVEFLDIDPFTFNICEKNLEIKLEIAKKKNILPKLIIIVHLGGSPANLERIRYLSKKYNFKIIEDGSHALGSSYKRSKIGSCKYSDITVFSFHAIKNITTGEGGACLTNNKFYYKKIKLLSSHGIKRVQKNKPTWYYEQHFLGYNYRITNFQAALGISQLNRLNFFVKKRNEIANFYIKNLRSIKLIEFQRIISNCVSSYHLFIIRVNKRIKKMLYYKLKKNKIQLSFHYIPVYLHPYYKKKNNQNLIAAKKYYNECLSLPIHTNLSVTHLKKIINAIKLTIEQNKNF
jgi:UDP-4-amino-4,6-dideoxy-N-acetyl-beta-L-altrosamine transaminase